MSDVEISGKARSLLDAAKGDGPSALSKAKIWGGVAATVGAAGAGVGAGAGGAAGAGAAATGSGKLIALGALFGSAVTVGIAVALVHVGVRTPSETLDAAHAAIAATGYTPQGGPAALISQTEAAGLTRQARSAALTPQAGASERIAQVEPVAAPAPVSPLDVTAAQGASRTATSNANAHEIENVALPAHASQASAPKRTAAHLTPKEQVSDDDALERESLLVAEARGALVRGDAARALSAIRAARAQTSHALEPEEMALEAKALRTVGRASEASDVEAQLRARYPDHALAR